MDTGLGSCALEARKPGRAHTRRMCGMCVCVWHVATAMKRYLRTDTSELQGGGGGKRGRLVTADECLSVSPSCFSSLGVKGFLRATTGPRQELIPRVSWSVELEAHRAQLRPAVMPETPLEFQAVGKGRELGCVFSRGAFWEAQLWFLAPWSTGKWGWRRTPPPHRFSFSRRTRPGVGAGGGEV